MCDEVTKSENVSASRKRGDAITASPRPWRAVDPHYEDAGVDIFDAEGARVCKDLTAANAALIVDAVNERDHLRDLVRKLVNLAANLLSLYETNYHDEPSREFVAVQRALLREARTAIGEAAT